MPSKAEERQFPNSLNALLRGSLFPIRFLAWSIPVADNASGQIFTGGSWRHSTTIIAQLSLKGRAEDRRDCQFRQVTDKTSMGDMTASFLS